jgi:hypothetical protein
MIITILESYFVERTAELSEDKKAGSCKFPAGAKAKEFRKVGRNLIRIEERSIWEM